MLTAQGRHDHNPASPRKHVAPKPEQFAKGSSMQRRSWLAPLALLIAIENAASAWPWGGLGNRATARLAEWHMTPEAKAAVAALLEFGVGR